MSATPHTPAAPPRHFRTMEQWTLILAALVILAAVVALPAPMTLAVTVGAGVMVLNAVALRRIGERVLASTEARPGRLGFAVLLFNLKMLILASLVYVAINMAGLDAIGLVIGISVFPAAMVIAALRLGLGGEAADAAPAPGELNESPRES